MIDLVKRPGGFVPLAISAGFLTAFGIGIIHATLVRQPDEDAGAHLTLFATSWIPKRPSAALKVLALQSSAALGVLAIVFFRHL
jgi:hypothetical protein